MLFTGLTHDGLSLGALQAKRGPGTAHGAERDQQVPPRKLDRYRRFLGTTRQSNQVDRETKERRDAAMMAGQSLGFSRGDLVVYPPHGLGRIARIEKQKWEGRVVALFVVRFEQDRLTLWIPFHKAGMSGLRALSTASVMEEALAKLSGPASGTRPNLTRRAIEYTARINSGDLIIIAQVVRDLFRRSTNEGKGSTTERLCYEQALDRLTREVAAVERIDVEAAAVKIEQLLTA